MLSHALDDDFKGHLLAKLFKKTTHYLGTCKNSEAHSLRKIGTVVLLFSHPIHMISFHLHALDIICFV